MITIIISIILLIILFIIRKEYFLVPSHDNYCENIGLDKSYLPQICMILENDGTIKYQNKKRNCKCINPKTGFCVLCYPETN